MNFDKLSEINDSFVATRLLQVAVKLRLFDELANGPLNAFDLSRRVSSSERGVDITLHALASLGLLKKDNDRFANSETAQTYLVASSPKYFGNMFLMNYEGWSCWERLEHAIRSGKSQKDAAPEKPEAVNPESPEPRVPQKVGPSTETFIAAMHAVAMARGDAEILAEEIDLKNVHTLLDLGGGPGTYSAHFCRANPQLECVVFDLPEALKASEPIVKRFELGRRLMLMPGNYLRDELPGKFDMVFMSNILHNEDEHENQRLLKKVFYCLNDGGKIVIKDYLMNDSRTAPTRAALFSVRMLLFSKGRSYSFSELRTWLYEAGFQDIEHTPPEPPLVASLVTAVKR